MEQFKIRVLSIFVLTLTIITKCSMPLVLASSSEPFLNEDEINKLSSLPASVRDIVGFYADEGYPETLAQLLVSQTTITHPYRMIGRGNFGSLSPSNDTISEFHQDTGKNAISTLAFVAGADLATLHDFLLLIGYLQTRIEEGTALASFVKKVKKSIAQDTTLIRKAKTIKRTGNLALSENYALLSSLQRLTELSPEDGGNNTSWVLPLALEMLETHPALCFGTVDDALSLNNLQFPIISTILLYSARSLKGDPFEGMMSQLVSFYPASLHPRLASLLTKTQFYSKGTFHIPFVYTYGGNHTLFIDFSVLQRHPAVQSWVKSGGSLKLPVHLGDCSSLIGAIAAYKNRGEEFSEHPLIKNRPSTLLLRTFYDFEVSKTTIPPHLGNVCNIISEYFIAVSPSSPPQRWDLLLWRGHIAVAVAFGTAGQVTIVELNRTDDPKDPSCRQGIGFRTRLIDDAVILRMK